MSKLEEARKLAAEYAEEGPDYNEAQSGGSARLLPAGYAFARLVEYIELGKQVQEYQGVVKPPALEAQIGFALYGEGYQNDDGTPYLLRPYPFAMFRNDKARAFKLFKALNWKGTAKNIGQLLGEAWLAKIVQVPKNKTDKTLVSRIDLEGFLPPLDPVTKQPYLIPMPDDGLFKLFIWDRPTLTAWDELYVDGTWDDGKSKNRVQETILGAADFAGSALEALLMENQRGIPAKAPAGPATPSAPAQGSATAQDAPAAPTAPAMPAMPALPL